MRDHVPPTSFTQSADPGLFAKYVELRRQVFLARYPLLPADFGLADDTDRVSHIAFALQEGTFAGAARLTISTPSRPRELPLEVSSFRLRQSAFWQQLSLARRPYAEISRMAVDPRCTDSFAISCGLGRLLCQIAADHHVDLIFSICPPGAARLNRLNAKKCGVRYEIYPENPTEFGIPMSLCCYSGVLRAYGPQNEEVA